MADAMPPKTPLATRTLWNILLLAIATLSSDATVSQATDQTRLLIIVGASGQPEFQESFAGSAEQWRLAGERAGAKIDTVGLSPTEETTDRQQLQDLLEAEKKETSNELWLVLIGHGTFDHQAAKFNLRGPDFSAVELAEWLKPFHRPLAILNGASASAPFVNALSGPNRVVITATKSGQEQNYARFGEHLAHAITDPSADLDKDDQTSLLEAYLTASRSVQEWYDQEDRLATEHALLDDNGDGQGTPATWFRGIRAVKKAKAGASPDGLRAHQFHLVRSESEQKMPPELRARRDQLEITISALRDRKDKQSEELYYQQLEPLLLEMAQLYEQTDKPAPENPANHQ